MLTEQEFETFKAQFCDGKSWTATFLEPGGLTRWKCNACGKEIQDNLTISASLIFGVHYKPEAIQHEPHPYCCQFHYPLSLRKYNEESKS